MLRSAGQRSSRRDLPWHTTNREITADSGLQRYRPVADWFHDQRLGSQRGGISDRISWLPAVDRTGPRVGEYFAVPGRFCGPEPGSV